MKKIPLLLILISSVLLTRAQRFFYIEPGNMASRIIQQELLTGSQHIVKSVLMSDYIIKTAVASDDGPNKTTLNLIVEDSVTFKPIYQVKEEYLFNATKTNNQLLLSMAMKTLVERSMNQIIYYAKNDRH